MTRQRRSGNPIIDLIETQVNPCRASKVHPVEFSRSRHRPVFSWGYQHSTQSGTSPSNGAQVTARRLSAIRISNDM